MKNHQKLEKMIRRFVKIYRKLSLERRRRKLNFQAMNGFSEILFIQRRRMNLNREFGPELTGSHQNIYALRRSCMMKMDKLTENKIPVRKRPKPQCLAQLEELIRSYLVMFVRSFVCCLFTQSLNNATPD